MAAPKILVIEDDLAVLEELNTSFLGKGYDVFTVKWGRDGILSALTVHPDLVILDVRLPDIDGFEVASHLRLERRTQDTPILFLAEHHDRADRLRGLELGAEDYIIKPLDIEELELRVRNILRRVHRSGKTHPVSGLPVGGFLDDRLTEYINKGDCHLLLISLDHIDGFRESYGFVAADDVLRAMSVMITNTLREMGSVEDFLGQMGSNEFILIVPSGGLPGLKDRLQARLAQSLDFFYPIKDRELTVRTASRLTVKLIELECAPGQFSNVNQLKAELSGLKR